MGNGITRPAKALTGLKKEGVPSAPRHYSNERPGRTTAGTVLTNSSSNSYPTAYTSKEDHLVAPSSNPYQPAAPSLKRNKDNIGSSPSLASPVRAVFSASLERSLESSGKRRPKAQASASSWTAGPLTRDRKKSVVEQAASTTSTSTTQILKKRLGAPTRHSAAGRREDRGITKRAASPHHHRWKHLRGKHRALSSEVERRGEGGTTTTVVETIIDNNSSSPARPRRGRRNLYDPPSKERPSAAVVVVGAARKVVHKEEENQAEKKWVENSAACQTLSLAKQRKQQQQQRQSEEVCCKGDREGQQCCFCSRSIPRSGGGTHLPTEKCWEGKVIEDGGGVSRNEDETKKRRPRQRPVRSRSYVDTVSPQRTENTGGASTVITDGRKPRDIAMEGGSSGIAAAVGRNGEGIRFGRDSSDASRLLRLQGRGGARGRAAHGNGTGGGGGGGSFSSGMLLGDERQTALGADATAASSPPVLQLPVSSAAEDAACYDLEDTLSACSSLPPMTGSATITTDLIFEESSLEDSGASVSQASSTERNCNDNVGGGGGGGGGVAKSEGGGGASRGKRAGGGGVCRQRNGVSSEAFVRTRSVGRGLSNLMARIHEQEECNGGALGSPRDPLPRGIGSRPSTGETFRVQELSDSDHDGHEEVLTTPPLSSSPTADLTAASSVMSVGHQRAALELRNLTLEREVEQLKTHLRSLGGEDVAISDLHGVRRSRPRPQHRIGERALLHRSAAPPPLSEASAPASHRGGVISCRSGGDVSLRGQGQAGRTRRGDSATVHPVRKHGDGGGGGGGVTALAVHQKTAAGEAEAAASTSGGSSVLTGQKVQPAPSPPRKRGSGSRRASASTTAMESSSTAPTFSSSPARRLRTSRLRSPTSASAASTGGEILLSPRAGKRSEAVRSLGIGNDGGGLDPVGGKSQTGLVNKSDGGDSSHELGQALPQDLLGGAVEPRPLPRLRKEEAERRRALEAKPRAAKTPINLGGMVSGIKHTLLSRRRSTGDRNTQLVTSAGNLSTVRGRQAFGENRSIKFDDDHDGCPAAFLSSGDKTTPSNTAATAAATAATATGKEPDNSESRKRGSRRPTRGAESHSSSAASSSRRITSVTAAAVAPAVGRQRGRDVLRGPQEAGRAREAGEEGSLEGVASTKQAATGAETAATTRTEAHDAKKVVDAGVAGAARPFAAGATTVECGASDGGAGGVVSREAGDAANDSPVYGRWPATLDAQWAEVEFMLCHEVDCEESLQYTIEATEAGLVFMDKLEEKAQELGILKGQLSRWLLPFNTDTSVEEQQAATPRRFQESLLASSATSGTAGSGSSGTLTEEEAEYLTAGARRVRQLVRLKIADDNDLNTVKEALVTMAGFFVSISEEAAKREGSATPFSVLQERRAMSPITRPPPLPSISRPCTATQAAARTKANDDGATASATKQADTRQADGGVGRGTSRTPAPTTKPALLAEPTVLAAGRANRAVIGGRSMPEAGSDRNQSHTSLSLALNGAASEMLPRETLAAEDAATSMAPSATEPGEVITTPREISRDSTAAASTFTNAAAEGQGSLGAAGGCQQGQGAGTVGSSDGSIVSTIAPSSTRGDGEGVVGSPSSHLAEHRQVGTTMAPAESLVRLKRRRQQAKTTRSSSRR